MDAQKQKGGLLVELGKQKGGKELPESISALTLQKSHREGDRE